MRGLGHRRKGNPWILFTDLSVGLFALFVFAFITLWLTKDKVDSEYKAKEKEYLSCLEDKKRTQKSLSTYGDLIGKNLKSSIEKGLIVVQDGNIDIQASLLFDLGKADITPVGLELISQISQALIVAASADTTFMIMVAGYTDDVPMKTPQFKSNWELASARAQNVLHALRQNNFPGNRVFAAGFGEYQPKAPNTTADNRALNRRVEILRVPMQKNRIAFGEQH